MGEVAVKVGVQGVHQIDQNQFLGQNFREHDGTHLILFYDSGYDCRYSEKMISTCFSLLLMGRVVYRPPIYHNGTTNTLKSPLTTELRTLGLISGIRRQNSIRIRLQLKKNFFWSILDITLGKGTSYGVQIIKMVDDDRKSTKNILEDSKTRLLI